MNVPEDLRYTKDHEWIRKQGDDVVVIGLTDYAQDALGDITYLELPEADTELEAGSSCGVVESVKTFSDIYAPVSGRVTEVNTILADNEYAVNDSPYEDGWLFAIAMSDPSEWNTLLTAEAYIELLDAES